VNFQPATEAAPAGYLKDAGSVYSVRSNGKSYGWNLGVSLDSRIRRGAVPIPELDTLIHFQKNGSDKTWEYALPNGSYPVIVVAGDPATAIKRTICPSKAFKSSIPILQPPKATKRVTLTAMPSKSPSPMVA
jgi:hypothetical protein